MIKPNPNKGAAGPNRQKTKMHATRETGRGAKTQKHARNSSNNNWEHQTTLNKQHTKIPIKRARKTSHTHTAETEAGHPRTDNAMREEKPNRRSAKKKKELRKKKDLTTKEPRKGEKHKNDNIWQRKNGTAQHGKWTTDDEHSQPEPGLD